MKQHISIEQLNELSDKGKEKLLDWWQGSTEGALIDNLGGCGDDEHCAYRLTCFEDVPPLSIGQMIEILDEYKEIEQFDPIPSSAYVSQRFTYKRIIWIKDIEFCDHLWQAVKEVLEK